MYISWCTSDTKLFIGGSEYSDPTYSVKEPVYLLNPYGDPYIIDNYDGNGKIGKEDMLALLAKWNYPDKCKDTNEDWLPNYEIYHIGNLISSNYNQVMLKYPIKIVSKPVSYDDAAISPQINGFLTFETEDTLMSIQQSFQQLEKAYSYLAVIKEINNMDLEKQSTMIDIINDRDFLCMLAQYPEINQHLQHELANKARIYNTREILDILDLNDMVVFPETVDPIGQYSDEQEL